jgi:hypothetical protein
MTTGERARLLEAGDANCGEVTNHAKKLDVVFEATEQTRRNHATKCNIQTEGKSRELASTAAGVGLGMSANRQSFTQRNRGRDGGRIGSGICRVCDPAGWYSMRCGVVLIHRWEFVCLSVRVCCSTDTCTC